MKILCLGNEFIKQDSLAKKVGILLEKQGYEIINIKNSFEMISYLQKKEDLIILDVVENLKEVKTLKIKDLKENNILTAHDFDASFFMKLMGKELKIIGLPQEGNPNKISEQLHNHLTLKK